MLYQKKMPAVDASTCDVPNSVSTNPPDVKSLHQARYSALAYIKQPVLHVMI